MYARRLSLSFLLLLLFVLWSPIHGFAEPLKQDRLDVFQLKSITKKQRHEFTPMGSITMNDPYVLTMTAGLSYTYHINEGIGFELSGAFAFSSATPLVEQMRTSGEKAILRPSNGGQSRDEFNPAVSFPQLYASACLVWSPLIGKFVVGNSIVDTNVYIIAGAGYVMNNRANQIIHLPSVNFGIGWRFFLNKWLSFKVDVRDIIFSQKLFIGQDVNILVHSVFVNVGFGFLLPTTPNYG